MSGLTFNGGETADQIISNDPFFPNISLKKVRESLRFDGSVSDPRLIEAIENAMLDVNAMLAVLKSKGASLAALATPVQKITSGMVRPAPSIAPAMSELAIMNRALMMLLAAMMRAHSALWLCC